ncbi:MAG: STAS domain-containing protein [Gemmatimonadales bacterium]
MARVNRLQVRGPLDSVAVAQLRRRIAQGPADTSVVLVDCTAVSSIDAVGAVLLWRLCQEVEREAGRRVRVIELPCRFASRLRHHPLLQYAPSEDDLFRDPFALPIPSGR